MKPPRITSRTLMVFVALAAVTTWGYTMWRRSAEFAVRATHHLARMEVRQYNLDTLTHDKNGNRYRYEHQLTAREETSRMYQAGLIQYEERLYHKYRRAMYFPWLSVGPDPAPPTARQLKNRIDLPVADGREPSVSPPTR